MKRWWQEREPGERWFLSIGAGAITLLLVYAFLWEPLQTRIAQQHATLAEQQGTLEWMRRASSEVRQLRTRAADQRTDGPQPSLLGILESSAREQGLRDRIGRMEPVGDDTVRLDLREVGFDRALRWIATLQQSHGVEVVETSVVANASPGTVNGSFTLRR